MKKILTVDNMRKSDAYTIANFVPSRQLMLRAGKGVFKKMEEAGIFSDNNSNACDSSRSVGIICGSGNNAGDGYVVAQLIAKKYTSIKVELLLLKEKFSEDGKYYFEKCVEVGIPWRVIDKTEDFHNYAYSVDCILGTGFSGDVRGLAFDVIQNLNQARSDRYTFVVSVDINSGLNGDTGMSSLCVHSDLTICIGGYKPGVLCGIAPDVITRVDNVDIGIVPVDKPYLLVDNDEYQNLAPKDFENNIVIKDISDISKIAQCSANKSVFPAEEHQ